MKYFLDTLLGICVTIAGLAVFACALVWFLVLAVVRRVLPLIFLVAIAVWFLTGCVYQPIHVELYNVTDVSAESIDVGIDASRNTTQDTYHEPR